MSDTPKTDNLCLDLDDGFARQSDLIAFARDLERENAALRKELDWKTERLKLLSNCLHKIDGFLKQTATSIFVDVIGATRKESQP